MESVDFKKIRKIYFAGIGGIGVSAIARFMLANKKIVVGSELNESETVDQLRNLGIKIIIGQKTENITKDIDLLVYSPALPDNHPERVAGKKLKIKELSYPEILGILSVQYNTIAISGTHGKSTTTAITGLIFETAKKDPNVIVGSKLKHWHGNMRLGTSDILIAEACEWKAHFLELSPQTILMNNLELDHPDCYKDDASIVKVFQKFANKLKKDNLLILNNDSKLLKQIKTKSKVFTFGIKNKSNLMAKNIKIDSEKLVQTFNLYLNSIFLGNIEIHLPGIFNVYNCLAAISISLNYGVDFKSIKLALKKFTGIWRRFDRVGYFEFKNNLNFVELKSLNNLDLKNKALVISDYGHHPTAVKATIKATHEFYKNKRIVLAFQPHEHTRTKVLLKNYIKAFDKADVVIFEEIYTVPGRESKKDIALIKGIEVVNKIKKHKPNLKITYAKDNDEVICLIRKTIKKEDVLMIMGAGEIYNIISKLKDWNFWENVSKKNI